MTTDSDNLYWPAIRKFLSGYNSGVFLVLAGHPFDTIKVRLQSEGTLSTRFQGPMHCVRQTLAHEGIPGLYKGMAAPLFATGGINCVLFGTQYNVVQHLIGREGRTVAKTTDHMKGALITGAFISFLVTPMEGIKAKLQVQYAATSSSSGTGGSAGGAAGAGGRQYKGPVDCFLKVLRQQGLQKGIYRGWLPVVASRMSNYSYFGGQVFFSGLIASGVGVQLDQGEQLPVGYSLISGGLAGCTYWLSCYPLDVSEYCLGAGGVLVVVCLCGCVAGVLLVCCNLVCNDQCCDLSCVCRWCLWLGSHKVDSVLFAIIFCAGG